MQRESGCDAWPFAFFAGKIYESRVMSNSDIPGPPNPAEALSSSLVTVQKTADKFSDDLLKWFERNTLDAAMIFGSMLAAAAALLLLRRVLLVLFASRAGVSGRYSPLRQFLFRLTRSTHPLFLLILGGWLVAQFATVPKGIIAGYALSLTIMGVLQAGLWVREGVLLLIERRLARQGGSEGETPVSGALGVITWLINFTIGTFTLLVLLDQLGVNITTLVAGLGIGGLAIGLAAQGIMADLFSALSIVFDKPFVRGDVIAFGDKIGTVENVGLKTSRIRALSGEMIVVSNTQLLGQVIHNHKRIEQRRVLFKLGVTYTTSPELVEKIPQLLRDAIEAESACKFDRAHFCGLGDSALLFEVVYYYQGGDMAPHMDAQQAILLRILRSFAAQNISFAFPTQTIELRRATAH